MSRQQQRYYYDDDREPAVPKQQYYRDEYEDRYRDEYEDERNRYYHGRYSMEEYPADDDEYYADERYDDQRYGDDQYYDERPQDYREEPYPQKPYYEDDREYGPYDEGVPPPIPPAPVSFPYPEDYRTFRNESSNEYIVDPRTSISSQLPRIHPDKSGLYSSPPASHKSFQTISMPRSVNSKISPLDSKPQPRKLLCIPLNRKTFYMFIFIGSAVLLVSAILLFVFYPRSPSLNVVSIAPRGSNNATLSPQSSPKSGQKAPPQVAPETTIRVAIPGVGQLNGFGQVVRQINSTGNFSFELDSSVQLELKSDNYVEVSVSRMQVEVFLDPGVQNLRPPRLNTTVLKNVKLRPQQSNALTVAVPLRYTAASIQDPIMRQFLDRCALSPAASNDTKTPSDLQARVKITFNMPPFNTKTVSEMKNVRVGCPKGNLEQLKTVVSNALVNANIGKRRQL